MGMIKNGKNSALVDHRLLLGAMILLADLTSHKRNKEKSSLSSPSVNMHNHTYNPPLASTG